MNPEVERASRELFQELDDALSSSVAPQFFQEPKLFRSIVEILNVVDAKANRSSGSSNLTVLSSLKEDNPAYDALLDQRSHAAVAIEAVVKFEHGGLNNTMETMTEVVKEYNRGREDVRGLRRSLSETTGVLTSKRNGQISMRDLWLKKVEAEQSLRIMKDLEFLKETPLRLQRLMQQRRFLSAVLNLNKATTLMFGEDLVAVQGLALVREQLMELKGTILESVVTELQSTVLGLNDEEEEMEEEDDDDEDSGGLAAEMERDYVRRRELRSQYAGTMGSVDMKDLTEESEAALVNPTSRANSTKFIRFLVRAVGALSCEEDVERMLLENTANQFGVVVRRVREAAILRKLRKIKQGISEKEGNTAMFAHYLGTLLDASVTVLQRLLFVLRLLFSMRLLRTGESMGRYEMKEYNRKAVLQLFDDIELSINKELRAHFVEKEVAAVMDKPTLASSSSASAGGVGMGAVGGSSVPSVGPMGDGDDDAADYKDEDNAAIFLTSASLAAPVYKKVLFFADWVNDIMVAEGVHDPKGGRADAVLANFGSENAAKPVTFLDAINPNKPVSILDALIAKTDKLAGKAGSAGQLSIMDALMATGHTDTKFSSLVLEAVQLFLEEELMPLVQLSVNNDLREIQLNPNHFSLPLTSGQGASTEAASRALGENVPLSYATLSCASTALPLFNYWLQLPQHNDMVLTILERLVGGFKQAAREEFENKCWKLMSFEERHRSKVLGGMRRDPVMAAYRASVYDGASSLDELLSDYYEAGATRRSSSFGGAAEAGGGSSSHSSSFNAELESWGGLWELGLSQYPTEGEKGVLKDFHSVATIASIAHGCDWLVQQLQRACAATCKQHAREAAAREEKSSNHLSNSGSAGATGTGASAVVKQKAADVLNKLGIAQDDLKSLTQAVVDEQQPLRNAICGFCKDLSKLADDCLAVLRGEWQVACFHFLHKLAQVKFGSVRTKEDGPGGGTSHEAEAVIAELNQHLSSFQEAALACISSPAVSVCLSPLALLAPRVLMRVVQTLCTNGNLGADADRAKPLRMIVACQQSLVMLLDSTKPNPATQQRLQKTLGDEFERVRRYVTLLDMPPKELQQWIRSNGEEYADYEFQTLWKQSVAKAGLDPATANTKHQSFDELWRDVLQKNKAAQRKAAAAGTSGQSR